MGVATFYNRKDGKPFDEQDEVLMEVNSRHSRSPAGDTRGSSASPRTGDGVAGAPILPAGSPRCLWADVPPPTVPDSVPGLVSAEHRHLRQDEQTGEPQGHRPGHGAVPRALRQGRDSAHPGTAPVPAPRQALPHRPLTAGWLPPPAGSPVSSPPPAPHLPGHPISPSPVRSPCISSGGIYRNWEPVPAPGSSGPDVTLCHDTRFLS